VDLPDIGPVDAGHGIHATTIPACLKAGQQMPLTESDRFKQRNDRATYA
jgi:hypothetical protein